MSSIGCMYGVVASEPEGDEGSGPTGPQPFAIMDFVNNVYVANGRSYTLADGIDLTSRRSASGLQVIHNVACQILGPFLDIALTANWTLLIEVWSTDTVIVEGLGAASKLFPFTIYSAAFDSQCTCYFWGGGAFFETSDGGALPFRDIRGGDTTMVSGINRCAYTVTDTHSAMSVNGESITSANIDDTPLAISSWTSFPATQCQTADTADTSPVLDTFVRKISFYEVQVDGFLPVLSSL